ncbi:MAG TPA: P1 family peptidase [Bryobacteraceae bacterium]|nr:P1 family peptidase [Bryobacteraceae bacterium]
MKGLTDIPGIKVGQIADYDAITGCTAILCEQGAVGGVDIRGSASGTEETPALDPGHITPQIHGILLAGGSAFGLEAAAGVRRYLEHKGVGFPTGSANVPIVAAAILYDLGIGKPNVRPTLAMGEAAAAAATTDAVAEGCVGAGTGATVGKILGMKNAMKSGLGTFTVELPGGLMVSALVAVNAVGDVRDPATNRILAGARKTSGSREFLDTIEHMKRSAAAPPVDRAVKNTTLAVVATNARLNKVQTNKLAQLAGLGMARTIYPANTMADGDTTFALASGGHEADVNVLGVAAAEAVASAILRAVKLARTMGGVPGLAG